MKITKRQLRKIIKEQLAMMPLPKPEKKKRDNEVSEVGMSINQLQAAAATALELSEMISELDHVPEWAHGKIAVLLDTLSDIRTYMVGKSIGQEETMQEAKLQEQRSPEFEFVELSDSVIGFLKSLDPMDRNPMAYELIDELEDLVSRGQR